MAAITEFATQTIYDAQNPSKSLKLGELWATKPCALFFLRRLGCAICRSYIKMVEEFREDAEKKGLSLVALSFEFFGEGSDEDRSFARGGFWNGPVYVIDKSVYQSLFGRKGLMNGFFGLMDMNKEAYERAKTTAGNLKGDGFQLGGQFVVGAEGRVLLDHRQKAYGDDAKVADILAKLEEALAH